MALVNPRAKAGAPLLMPSKLSQLPPVVVLNMGGLCLAARVPVTGWKLQYTVGMFYDKMYGIKRFYWKLKTNNQTFKVKKVCHFIFPEYFIKMKATTCEVSKKKTQKLFGIVFGRKFNIHS